MKISRKILAVPFIASLLTGQVCFAAILATPPPSITIDPSVLTLTDPLAVTPTTTTPPPTTTTPTPVRVDTTTVTDPTPPPTTTTGTTTDPNGTTATNPPPATTDPNGTTTGTTVPPRETTQPTPTPEPTPPTRTNNTPTEEPTIGLLDVPLETNTQEQCSTQIETPICPAPEQIAKTLTPILTENQLKMALLVFFGGGLGTLLWVFSANIMNSSQMKREEVRFDRQQRAANESRRLDQLSKTYGRLSDTIASLYKESGNKLLLNKDALKNYLSSSIELEMFGSEESLTAHKQFLGMLTSGNSVTKETFDKQKTTSLVHSKKISDYPTSKKRSLTPSFPTVTGRNFT